MEGKPTVFEGTPTEIEAMIRTFFDMTRGYFKVYREVTDDEHADEKLDAYERTVWKVELTPLETIAKDKCRKVYLAEAMRIESERKLFEIVSKVDDDGQSEEN